MKILVTGDWHVQPSNFDNIVPAMQFVADYVEETRPDIMIHTGDVFHTRGRLDPTSVDHVQETFLRCLQAGANVIVIPGNHDAANAFDEVDSVSGILRRLSVGLRYTGSAPAVGFSSGGPTFRPGPKIGVASTPGIAGYQSRDSSKVCHVAAVPCPSKYHLLAKGAEAPNLLDALGAIYRGLAVQAKEALKTGPVILVLHGGVAGAKLENEQLIGVGQDVTIPREFLVGPWDCMIGGHLHSAQQVAGVIYPGSLTQLTHAQAGYNPTLVEITLRDRGPDRSPEGDGSDKPYELKVVHVPVAHRHITVEIDATDKSVTGAEALGAERPSLIEAVKGQLVPASPEGYLDGAKVRVKIKAPSEEIAATWNEQAIREAFPQVQTWKFVVERQAPLRIRSDATVGTPLKDLLLEWSKLNPELAPVEARLVELGLELDGQITTAGDLPQLADYEPVRTVLKNFKQFPDAKIDWTELPKITVVKGPNASGKTNAIRAEAFALFGTKALQGSPLRRVVREGENQGGVEHTFKIGTRLYRIDRTVKLSSSLRAAGDISFATAGEMEEIDGKLTVVEEWMSLNGPDARETQKRIERLVGSADMFFSTGSARQFEIARLLHVSPAERKDVLLDAVQAGRFALLEEKARAENLRLQKALEKERAKLATEEELAERLDEVQTSATNTKTQLDDLLHSIKTTELELAQAREDRDGVKVKIAEANALAQKRGDLHVVIDELDQRASDRSDQKTALDATLEEAKGVEEGLERLGELREEGQLVSLKAKRDTELAGDINTTTEKIAAAERERGMKIASTTDKIERLQKQTVLIESVPCEGKKWTRITGQAVPSDGWTNMAGCQFLLDAIKAREELPTLEEGLPALKADKSHTGPLTATLRQLEQDRVDNGFKQAELDKINKEIAGLNEGELNKKAQAISTAKGKLEAIKKEVGQIMLDREAKQRVFKALATPTNTAELIRARDKLTTLIEDAVKALADANENARSLSTGLGQVNEQLAKCKEAAEAAAKTKAVVDELAQKALAAAGLVLAVARDGIPYLILERALPQLQNIMNELLDGSAITVEISPIRDGETGSVRDEVNISFHDDNGEQVLEDASGQQGNLIGMIMRAGVAVIQGDRAGSRPTLFRIDEGFGAYDVENIPHAREVIHRLADLFGRVVYITHVPEVQEAAMAEIQITPTTEGSTLVVSQ